MTKIGATPTAFAQYDKDWYDPHYLTPLFDAFAQYDKEWYNPHYLTSELMREFGTHKTVKARV